MIQKQDDKEDRVTLKEDFDQWTLIPDYGARIVNTLSGSSVTPFPDRDALRDFTEKVNNAKDDESINNVFATSTQIMDLLQKKKMVSHGE